MFLLTVQPIPGASRTNACLPFGVLLGGIWFALAVSGAAQPYTWTTIAGVAEVSGAADGTNSTARFYRPSGLARDGAGNIYVADLLNHTIRKVAPVGANWVVSTLAGLAENLGSADGTNDQARFNRPSSVAVDNAGNLFVTDNYNDTIRKLTPAGTNWVVSTVAGLAGVDGSNDGTNYDARFDGPQAVAVDSNGTLYVTDRFNCTIRTVTPVGTNWVVHTIAGSVPDLYPGFEDGPNEQAQFNLPFGIARHNEGNLYVADFGNHAIRRISPQGPDWVTSTVAGFSGGSGSADGSGSQAAFNSPNGIAVDAAETVYVADQFNSTIRKLVPDGKSWEVSTVGGLALNRGTNDGAGISARFYRPWGIVVDGAGGLYVADEFNNTIRRGMLLSASPPALRIVLAAGQVILSWPTTASNYVLETTSALGEEASWAAKTNGITITGNDYLVTNDVSSAPAFFRLRGP